MKKFLKAILAVCVLAALAWALTAYMESRRSLWHQLKNPETVRKLKEFVALKTAQANADTNGVPSELRAVLKQAERGDWLAMSNSMSDIGHWAVGWQHGWQHDMEHDYWRPSGLKMAVKYVWCRAFTRDGRVPDYLAPPDMNGACGIAAYELYDAFDAFWNTGEKYAEQFGREIVASIPSGSIYLGDNGVGRFVPTVMFTPLSESNSFYILPQWVFRSSGTEERLKLLHSVFGKKINLLTGADMEKCFQDFAAQLQAETNTDSYPYGFNRLEGLAIQRMIAVNPQREFYLIEEVPIETLLPQFEPHGLILKVNPKPMGKISDEVLQHDHEFWMKEIQPLIGDWLKDETSLAEIAAFAKKVFGEGDLSGFTGDASFIRDANAQDLFVRSRCSIARIYAWRAKTATDERERKRMIQAADFAFRQVWAMCPHKPQAYNYVNFLLSQKRFDDAVFLMETCAALPQLRGDETVTNTLEKLKQWRKDSLLKPAN